eukprot:SAG25_NODE_380_length_8808_cov_3.861523_10_plen_328_part_00
MSSTTAQQASAEGYMFNHSLTPSPHGSQLVISLSGSVVLQQITASSTIGPWSQISAPLHHALHQGPSSQCETLLLLADFLRFSEIPVLAPATQRLCAAGLQGAPSQFVMARASLLVRDTCGGARREIWRIYAGALPLGCARWSPVAHFRRCRDLGALHMLFHCSAIAAGPCARVRADPDRGACLPQLGGCSCRLCPTRVGCALLPAQWSPAAAVPCLCVRARAGDQALVCAGISLAQHVLLLCIPGAGCRGCRRGSTADDCGSGHARRGSMLVQTTPTAAVIASAAGTVSCACAWRRSVRPRPVSMRRFCAVSVPLFCYTFVPFSWR